MPGANTLVVFLDDHYVSTPDGVYGTIALPYSYWKQYLDVFSEVRLVARVAQRSTVEPGWNRADGPGVRFLPLREYAGFWQNIRHTVDNLLHVRAALAEADCCLLKGSTISAFAWFWLKAGRRPYARTVMGHEGFTVAMLPSLQRFGLARMVPALTHWLGCKQVEGASCVHYWSSSLQRDYGTGCRAPSFVFAEVELADGVITGPRGVETFSGDPLKLVSVGRLSPEKGCRELILALKRLDQSGERRWSLEAIGGGPELEPLRALVAQSGLSDRIELAGMVPWGPELFTRLDRADLFVLPSLTEGMPRAPLEAMARGLPVISTTVGGMPDVLDAAQMVAPSDPAGLAELIRAHIGRRERLAARSRDAFERASHFNPAEVRRNKHEYWTALRDISAPWRRARAATRSRA